jgi:DNA-binding FadR family transcriptional regulator
VYATVADAKKSAIEWHKKILDAILNSDSEGAREAMTRHLEIAEQHDRQILLQKRMENNPTT